ncbi:MAG TPA: hypothetical protein EYH05_09960 [Anaerolineae bacterium]|nr:hypothetical protein [Anaerolineae bacterium]
MTTTTILHTVTIQAPVTAVFDFWKVPANHAKIHPLIVNIEEIKSGSDEDGRLYTVFEVTDRIKLLGIPYTVKYTTLMVQSGPAQLTFTTSQSPGIRIKNVMTFSPQADDTLVQEKYYLEAPGWLMGYVKRQVEQSHGRMMENAKTLLESDV